MRHQHQKHRRIERLAGADRTLHALAVIPHTGTELVGLNHPALQQQDHMWQQAMQQQLRGLSTVRLVTAAVCMHTGADMPGKASLTHVGARLWQCLLLKTQRQHALVLAKAQAPV
jgi:hypothetical protein